MLNDDSLLGFGYSFLIVLLLGGLLVAIFFVLRFQVCCTSAEQVDEFDTDIQEWRDHPKFMESDES
jgi:hypothetical protein